MAVETLFENKWLSLKQIVEPEQGINGYVFSHEERCQGRIIAILPWRRSDSGKIEYMVKSEVTPCWGLEPAFSALTGGWEGGSPLEDAQRELEEESGYTVRQEAFIALGESYASKSSDTRYSLFSVDLTGVVAKPHKGDGSALEATATSEWMSGEELLAIDDPQVHVMFNRLQKLLKGNPVSSSWWPST